MVEALKTATPPNYIEEVLSGPQTPIPGLSGEEATRAAAAARTPRQDPLYDEAVRIVTSERKPSISYVQRRLKIGYNRAARLLEAMEQAGSSDRCSPTARAKCSRRRRRGLKACMRLTSAARGRLAALVRTGRCVPYCPRRARPALPAASGTPLDTYLRRPEDPAREFPADPRRCARPRDRPRRPAR